ncbi:MAG TPA: hypothetical protein OIL76_05090 [Veillonellaceae bacterium]|nr:hypothetical protein [Veillonellaceae bacterium]
MKPLEDWRVNRGMTGSFLCWKFKEKKAVLYKQTFLMEGTLFWMGFTWQEEVHLSSLQSRDFISMKYLGCRLRIR